MSCLADSGCAPFRIRAQSVYTVACTFGFPSSVAPRLLFIGFNWWSPITLIHLRHMPLKKA